ncbi:MAG: thioredoxin-disulfide reductase [Elusimicrobia bacterium RIFCSPLOWO2_12_FULL_59_9]|nr:MAG: thioredoxin-disulfide reductase [Elusimicrobia bacterium RIFCSPLOWO2_12_FULL_59_9]
MSDELRKLVIIGSGAAGYTAGIYAARANLKPLLFGGVSMGGQLMITSDVENYPGFEAPILGPELMERMNKQCRRLGVEIIPENVCKADFGKRPFLLETTEGVRALAESVIIATGANAQWLGLPSEKKLMGHGVSACATCDAFFFKNKKVAVVGGGDTAMEESTFLTKFASEVTVIHRRDSLRASKTMQDRASSNPKIRFIWDSAVEEVLGEEEVAGVRVKNLKTRQTRMLEVQGLFIAIGHVPNTQVFAGQIALDPKGYIVADARTRTSVEGVFAAGDVMDPPYRQAVTAAGTGCMAALEAERFLEAQKEKPSGVKGQTPSAR